MFDNSIALYHFLAILYDQILLLSFFFFTRSPPHPFITVLTSSPEQATILIQQVNLLLVNSTSIKRYEGHYIRTFASIVSAHPYCACSLCHNVILRHASNPC